MSGFDDLEGEINRGLEGKNEGISMGFHRLNKYIGIRKKIYTLVFGASGSGKTAFVHSAFILNPFDWYMNQKRINGAAFKVKLKIPLFAMERGRVYTKAKWVSRKIFLDHGVQIPLAKMLGWWQQKMSPEEHDMVLAYSDYVNELLEVVDIIEGGQNPEAVRVYLRDLAMANGKIEGEEYHKVYIPNDENLMVIPIVDHMGLTKTQKGASSKKEAIDLLSEYLQKARDFYGYSPVMVAQINRNLGNIMNQKNESFEPSVDDIKESGSPGEAADTIMSLFDPIRYKTQDPSYKVEKFVDTTTGANYFRKIKLLKSTYSEDGVGFGMAFQGFTGAFKELPVSREMGTFDYSKLFTGQYFLED